MEITTNPTDRGYEFTSDIHDSPGTTTARRRRLRGGCQTMGRTDGFRLELSRSVCKLAFEWGTRSMGDKFSPTVEGAF